VDSYNHVRTGVQKNRVPALEYLSMRPGMARDSVLIPICSRFESVRLRTEDAAACANPAGITSVRERTEGAAACANPAGITLDTPLGR
jgi:hypothetical protein